MMKKPLVWLAIVVAALVGLSMVKNVVAKSAIAGGVKGDDRLGP